MSTLTSHSAHQSFVVRHIHCARCASTLQTAIASLPGVTGATVDQVIGWTLVDYDPRIVTGEELLAAVGAAGFEIERSWT